MANLFREKLLGGDEFVLTYELVPGRTSRGRSIEKAIELAHRAKEDGLLDALSITDNPGGNASLSPDVLGREIKDIGIDPIVHFACRDWNRYGMFSRALQLDRMSLENLLVLTGDYPTDDKAGTAKPCFDLDSATATCMLDGMNKGREVFCKIGKGQTHKTNFMLGSAVSCFKYAESELFGQYYKLLKKIRNGSSFVITQICYDARKFDELIRFLRQNDCDVPVLGSVYVLTRGAARFMNEGKVPGAFVSDKLLAQIESEAGAADKGKEASLVRSAKLIAVLKGLGYRGAHIAGAISYDQLKRIIVMYKELAGRWREFVGEFDLGYPGGFYLYGKDPKSGLNSDLPAETSTPLVSSNISYGLLGGFHDIFFNESCRLYPMLKRIAQTADENRMLKSVYWAVECVSKGLLFHCKKCGDCALQDLAYLCPESQCPKFLRNGPCGGSRKRYCEVRQDRLCVWVKVYERWKSHGLENKLKGRCVRPRDWELDGSSSWLNFYLGRDYHSMQSCCCQEPKS